MGRLCCPTWSAEWIATSRRGGRAISSRCQPVSPGSNSAEQRPDEDDDKREGNSDGRLDGQALLVPDVGADLVVEIRPWQHLSQASTRATSSHLIVRIT